MKIILSTFHDSNGLVMTTCNNQKIQILGGPANTSARIYLVFAESKDMVLDDTSDENVIDVLYGTDKSEGITTNSNGDAVFNIKINTLSSRHNKKRFRFKFVLGDLIDYSDDFKLIQRLRKDFQEKIQDLTTAEVSVITSDKLLTKRKCEKINDTEEINGNVLKRQNVDFEEIDAAEFDAFINTDTDFDMSFQSIMQRQNTLMEKQNALVEKQNTLLERILIQQITK